MLNFQLQWLGSRAEFKSAKGVFGNHKKVEVALDLRTCTGYTPVSRFGGGPLRDKMNLSGPRAACNSDFGDAAKRA